VLADNGTDGLVISASGPFSFPTRLAAGAAYAVNVQTQPSGPSQTCTVTNASGTVGAADVTNVAVDCKTNMYLVGGSVTGLSGSGLVLSNNGGDDLAVSANGHFSFATALAVGATYRVSVLTQPSNPIQNCTLTNGTARGTVGAAEVTTVAVVCVNVGRYVYTANLGDYSISAYAIDATSGALKAVAGSPYTSSLRASYVAAEPTGRFLYVLDNETGALGIAAPGIDVYSIDSGSGALTAVAGSPFAADAGGVSLLIHPNGKFAYTANVNSMSVSAYTLDTTEGVVIAPVSGSPFPSGSFPFSIAVDAGGRFAYTANNEGDVSAYTIDTTTGALTPVTGSPFKAGAGSFGISVDPSGRYAYVANNVSNDVSGFKIDATTGALSTMAGSPFAAGLNPTAAASDPSGTFLYVANGNAFGTPGGNTVSAFVIDAATGGLTPVPGSPFATATLSTAIAVDPSGKFVYVANGDPPANNISAFAIDQNTGALTPVPGSPFAAGANPQSITVSR
jgi:6-phosphogluconolactonase (cycloisomerase 2 family)